MQLVSKTQPKYQIIKGGKESWFFQLNKENKISKYYKEEILDVLIIGGGITGAGVALQASASGLKIELVEMQDFAQGTSSRSQN